MNISRRERILCLVILFLLVVLGGGHIKNYYDMVFQDTKEKAEHFMPVEEMKSPEQLSMESTDDDHEPMKIMVHISGAVLNPGLVTIESGKRVKDVIDLAGGVYDTADLDQINLAKIVHDEQKIYIPRKGEVVFAALGASDSQTSDISGMSSTSAGKVNINICSKAELVALPGIGEKTAEKIIEYRKEHEFTRIEDIMKVKGIGQKKFEAIKNLICIR